MAVQRVAAAVTMATWRGVQQQPRNPDTAPSLTKLIPLLAVEPATL